MIKTLTINQFMKIQLIIETYSFDENKMNSEIIKLFTGSLDVSKKKGDEIIRDVTELITYEPDLINRFEFNGIEYGFIPNLDDISTAEFIDLEEYLRDRKQLNRIAAILYRPIIKEKNIIKRFINKFYFKNELYNVEKYNGTKKAADVMNEVDYKVVLGAMVFFYSLGKDLLVVTNTYTERVMRKAKKKINS